jgi:DNA-directed RNA polymerase beta subunit
VNNWKIIFATVVIFGAGIVAGALLVDHANRDKVKRPKQVAVSGNSTNSTSVGASVRRDLPPAMEQRRIDFMRNVSSNLNLSTEQREHVDDILHEGQERIKKIWEPYAAKMREEMNDVREKIHAELTPGQKKRFDELMKRPPRKPDDASTNRPPRRLDDSPTNRPPREGRRSSSPNGEVPSNAVTQPTPANP